MTKIWQINDNVHIYLDTNVSILFILSSICVHRLCLHLYRRWTKGMVFIIFVESKKRYRGILIGNGTSTDYKMLETNVPKKYVSGLCYALSLLNENIFHPRRSKGEKSVDKFALISFKTEILTIKTIIAKHPPPICLVVYQSVSTTTDKIAFPDGIVSVQITFLPSSKSTRNILVMHFFQIHWEALHLFAPSCATSFSP